VKQFSLGELFSDEVLLRAYCIGPNFYQLLEEIVKPRMSEINEVTGQENDPHYVTHVLIHALGVYTVAMAVENAENQNPELN